MESIPRINARLVAHFDPRSADSMRVRDEVLRAYLENADSTPDLVAGTEREFRALLDVVDSAAGGDGFVYLVRMFTGDESADPVKIGFATNVARRLEGLQTGNPCQLVLVGAFRASKRDEAAMHSTTSARRIRGEWFAPNDPIHMLVDVLRGKCRHG